jgi:hypothetical protein
LRVLRHPFVFLNMGAILVSLYFGTPFVLADRDDNPLIVRVIYVMFIAALHLQVFRTMWLPGGQRGRAPLPEPGSAVAQVASDITTRRLMEFQP